jgi:hypothetical protein
MLKNLLPTFAVIATVLVVLASIVFVVDNRRFDEVQTVPVPHKFGAVAPANGGPNLNDPVVTGGYCMDMEPQPLSYIDATLPDGAVTDGGWYADAAAGRIPKGILLACSGTTANVAVDMLGFGGKPGQTNVVLTGVACGVVLPFLVQKVYQVGTTATTVQLCY